MKPITKPFTFCELRRMQSDNGCITAIVPYPWNRNTSNTKEMNDFVSDQITGSCSGLKDINYRLVGVDVGQQEVFIEVCGILTNWLNDQEYKLNNLLIATHNYLKGFDDATSRSIVNDLATYIERTSP